MLVPLYWVLITSFKVPGEVDNGPFYIPFVDFSPSLDAWHFMLVAARHAQALSQLGRGRRSPAPCLAVLIGVARRLCACAHPLPGQARRRRDLHHPAARRSSSRSRFSMPTGGSHRRRDRPLPPRAFTLARRIKPARRQQRHRVLDHLEPHHAADRRRAADLCDVPAAAAARHPGRADRHLHRGQPADRRLADA